MASRIGPFLMTLVFFSSSQMSVQTCIRNNNNNNNNNNNKLIPSLFSHCHPNDITQHS